MNIKGKGHKPNGQRWDSHFTEELENKNMFYIFFMSKMLLRFFFVVVTLRIQFQGKEENKCKFSFKKIVRQ